MSTKKSFAVIGLGRFGLQLVESLSNLDVTDIIAIDLNKESVQKAAEFTPNAFICDSTSEAALREVGVQNVDHAIIAIGQNHDSMLVSTFVTTIMLKKLGVKKITVRIDDDQYGEIIKTLGATNIISPLKIASDRLANKVVMDLVIDYFNITDDFNVFELEINEDFKEISLIDLNSRTNYGMNIILVKRGSKMFTPSKSDVLIAGDKVFVFGKKSEISKFESYLRNHI